MRWNRIVCGAWCGLVGLVWTPLVGAADDPPPSLGAPHLEACAVELTAAKMELSACKVADLGVEFVTTNELEGPAAEFQQEHGIGQHWIIYQSDIDPDNTGILDEQLLRTRMQDYADLPAGIIWLDWEGVWHERVRGKQGDYSQGYAIDQGRLAIDVCREEAPQHRYGFYQVPAGQYWSRDQAWIDEVASYARLTGHVDVTGTSVYDSYADARGLTAYEDDVAYVDDNARMLVWATRPHQQSYLWIMARWHDQGSPWPDRTPSDVEHTRHIRAGVLAEHEGRRIDGVLWWGNLRRIASDDPEIPEGMTVEDYIDAAHAHLIALFYVATTGDTAAEVPVDVTVHVPEDWWQSITEAAKTAAQQ